MADLRSELEELRGRVVTLQQENANLHKKQTRIFDAVLSCTPDLMFVLDREGRFLYANQALLQFWQKRLEDVVGKTRLELGYPPAHAARLHKQIQEVVDTGQPVRDCISLADFSGVGHVFEYFYSPVFDSSGKIEGVAGTGRDITEAKRLHDELLMFCNLAEQSPDFVGITGVNGETVYLNEAGRNCFGLEDMNAVRQANAIDFFEPKDHAFLRDTIMPTLLDQGRWAGEMNHRHQMTGGLIPIHYSAYVIRDADGKLIAFATISRDLREEKKARQKLRASEERLAFALEAAGDVGTWDWDVESGRIYCDERFARLYDVNPEEAATGGLPLSKFIDCMHPDDREAVDRKIQLALRTAGHYTAEYRLVQQDGHTRWVYAVGHVYNDADGKPVRFPGVVVDITERKRIEDQLRMARDEARIILESITDAFVTLDRDWSFIYVNPTAEKILGMQREKALGQNVWDLFPTTRDTIVEREYRRAASEKVAVEFEYYHRRWDRWFTIKAYPTQEGGISVYFRDITVRRGAEEVLNRQWRMFDTMLSHIPDHAYIIDLNGGHVYANHALLAMWGKSFQQVAGKSLVELFSPEVAAFLESQARKVVVTGQPVRDETLLTDPQGIQHIFESILSPIVGDSGKVEAVAGISRNVTQRKKAEEKEREQQEQLRESARLESLGILAGGVAHDFNNLLTGILGNASILAETDHEGDRSAASDIVLAAERAAELTRQMLAYSGKGRFIVEVIDLNTLIRENLTLLRATLSRSVSVEMELGKEPYFIDADRSQIQQVIMNLLINASEAVGTHPGKVKIRTAMIQRHSPQFSSHLQTTVAAGHYILLEICDNGTGMAPDTLKRIFDPFFTTKFTGRGLGLAAVLGIVKGHEGDMEVTSLLGSGTTFRMLLPISLRTASTSKQPEFTLAAAGQTVLVVDDELIVRTVATLTLQSRGFHVLQAANGVEALEVLRANTGVALVILDLTMPVMTGEQALPLIKEFLPAVPVILSSGFSEAEISYRFSGSGIAGVLQKPYTAQSIFAKVTHALKNVEQ